MMLVSEKLFEDVRKKNYGQSRQIPKGKSLLPGISREDLRASLGKRVRQRNVSRGARRIGGTKKIGRAGRMVKKADRKLRSFRKRPRPRRQIEAGVCFASLAVPSVKEVLAKLTVEAKRAEKLLQIL